MRYRAFLTVIVPGPGDGGNALWTGNSLHPASGTRAQQGLLDGVKESSEALGCRVPRS